MLLNFHIHIFVLISEKYTSPEMASGPTFMKVFTKRINKAAVKTDKAEEKLLEDEQYVPPPGILKGLKTSESGGAAQYVSLEWSNMILL